MLDGFDITVERRRVYAATTASNIASGHASRLTHRQHLVVPHVSTVASMHSGAYERPF
jgi:hypothetical protein